MNIKKIVIQIFTFIIFQEVFLLLTVICLFFSCLLHSPVRFSLRWVIVSQSNSFFYRYPVFKRQVISFHSGFSNGNFMQFNFKLIPNVGKNCGKFRQIFLKSILGYIISQQVLAWEVNFWQKFHKNFPESNDRNKGSSSKTKQVEKSCR